MKLRWILLLVAGVVIALAGTLSYYIDALWFDSLGYGEVFWRSLSLQSTVFSIFFAATFFLLYGAFIALKPPRLGDFGSDSIILVGGHPVRLPVGRVLRTIVVFGSFAIAFVTGTSMASNWMTFALWWNRSAGNGGPRDPVFGKPLDFYLFSLPALQAIVGWLLMVAVFVLLMSLFFLAVAGGLRVIAGRSIVRSAEPRLRGVAVAWAFLLLATAAETWLGRYERLFEEHTIFSGVTYTDAHVTLVTASIVAIALAAGAAIAIVSAVTTPRARWLIGAIVPAAIVYIGGGIVSAYVDSFIVKPNELVREHPYIAHNIEFTRQAYGLTRVTGHPFPAETTVEAADPANNQATLQNIRLWDWRVLQDTLRQLQEIRTYYDFPDIDIDRYQIDGSLRQVMLATRELNVEKLPVSSRNWINEKLIYTHGYGVTMNPVNGFTPEGLPILYLKDMPVQSTIPSLQITRPEVYFGEATNTDVYVKTRQQEFNYPQGESNSLTSYQGTGGIPLGGFFRRLLIAFARGDIGKLPFSDDITPESRLLMRRNVHGRVAALAPFLAFDPDPYIVIRADGRLAWLMDGFTDSDRYPYSRAYVLQGARVNYVRNSVKAVVDAYDGTTTFYVFDPSDPIIEAYRRIFPSLFKDVSSMPADLRAHVRYPELLLKLQADVYGLYHMTNPDVFYNREDLWSVATEIVSTAQRQQAMEPNFVLMTLPGESHVEFVEILPFTPANRNNLIGWIAGRSDGEHYGDAIVYDFPKTRLVDGPLQVEARIDQNPQLSGQLSLWNQQGSHVRRGALLVIPIGRALLYAEAIYLQAERSPMPELRLVVLAMQDRLAYAPTFEGALAGLFGTSVGAAASPAAPSLQPSPSQPPAAPAPQDANALIAQAAQDLADYQRLTADGKLAEAGQKLEHLKVTLEQLRKR
ncbi:MAG TPA: UPF0182 family protein [Vicinamibacterales bacterium]